MTTHFLIFLKSARNFLLRQELVASFREKRQTNCFRLMRGKITGTFILIELKHISIRLPWI